MGKHGGNNLYSSYFIYTIHVNCNKLFFVFQGVPVQTGNKDCGLFVMGYMKEIVYDKELDFVSKVRISISLNFIIDFIFTHILVKHATNKNFIIFQWLRRSNLVYTDDDINEIRTDFSKYFMKRHAS